MDELRRIERQYGCVAEYNRCTEDGADRHWEQTQQARLRYKENCRQADEYEKAGYLPIAEALKNAIPVKIGRKLFTAMRMTTLACSSALIVNASIINLINGYKIAE